MEIKKSSMTIPDYIEEVSHPDTRSDIERRAKNTEGYNALKTHIMPENGPMREEVYRIVRQENEPGNGEPASHLVSFFWDMGEESSITNITVLLNGQKEVKSLASTDFYDEDRNIERVRLYEYDPEQGNVVEKTPT